MATATAPAEPRSERGRRRRELDVVSPIDQIRVPDSGANIEATGAYAYYINPEGATISDALILYPNGGVPQIDDKRLASRYGENAEYYRARQARKGLEYVGVNLTEGGVRRLVEVLEQNRPDEILFIKEEIGDAKEVAKNSELPAIRNQAKRRVTQLSRRLAYLEQPLDPDALEAELKDIARAQELAQVPPAVLRVMRSMISDAQQAMIARFQRTAGPGSAGGDFTGVASTDKGE